MEQQQVQKFLEFVNRINFLIYTGDRAAVIFQLRDSRKQQCSPTHAPN